MNSIKRLIIMILCLICILFSTINAEEYSDQALYEDIEKEAEKQFKPIGPSEYFYQLNSWTLCIHKSQVYGWGFGTSICDLQYIPIANRLCLGMAFASANWFQGFSKPEGVRVLEYPENSIPKNDFSISRHAIFPLRLSYILYNTPEVNNLTPESHNGIVISIGAFSNLSDYLRVFDGYSVESISDENLDDKNKEVKWTQKKIFGSYGMELCASAGIIGLKIGWEHVELNSKLGISPNLFYTTLVFDILGFGAAINDEKGPMPLKSWYNYSSRKVAKRKEKIGKWVAAEYERRSQGCDLVIESIEFSDKYSIVPNTAVDAFEKSTLTVLVKNYGPGDAFDVKLVTSCDNQNLSLHKSVNGIGSLLPKEEKTINIDLSGGSDLKDGEAFFALEAKEKRGYDAQKKIMNIETRRYRAPLFEIREISLNDGRSGFAQGNGNGILETGEAGELNIQVLNKGEGAGLGLNADLSVPFGVDAEQLQKNIGNIPPGTSALVKYKVELPLDYDHTKMNFTLNLKDLRPIETARLPGSITTGLLSPEIRLSVDAYGEFFNGGNFPVTITVTNQGNADVIDFRLPINTPPGVQIEPPVISLNRLTNISQQLFAGKVKIDRTYSRPSLDFSGAAVTGNLGTYPLKCSYPVQLRRPELQVETYLPAGNSVLVGAAFEMLIRPINIGTLEAENVVLQVSVSEKFYNQTFEKDIGILPAMTGNAKKFSFPLVPRSISAKNLQISITVRQKDFAELDTLIFVPLVREAIRITQIISEEELPPIDFAELGFIKTINDTLKGLEAEGFCPFSENMTEKQMKEFAGLDALRNLTDKIAVRITSQNIAHDRQLVYEQVRKNVSNVPLNWELIECKLEMTEEGRRYRAKIKGDVLRSIRVK